MTSEGDANSEALEDMYDADWTMGHGKVVVDAAARTAAAAASQTASGGEGTYTSKWSGQSLRGDRSSREERPPPCESQNLCSDGVVVEEEGTSGESPLVMEGTSGESPGALLEKAHAESAAVSGEVSSFVVEEIDLSSVRQERVVVGRGRGAHSHCTLAISACEKA